MRVATLAPSLAAAAFGVAAVTFGIVEFIRAGDAEAVLEAKLASIAAGTATPEKLMVARKYVNPGKHGLPHVVFRGERAQKVDVTATVNFFNSVQPGEAMTGYSFPDGYFFPANRRPPPGFGPWFVLGVSGLLGGLALFIVIRLRRVT
jgi:hypothetical protein